MPDAKAAQVGRKSGVSQSVGEEVGTFGIKKVEPLRDEPGKHEYQPIEQWFDCDIGSKGLRVEPVTAWQTKCEFFISTPHEVFTRIRCLRDIRGLCTYVVRSGKNIPDVKIPAGHDMIPFCGYIQSHVYLINCGRLRRTNFAWFAIRPNKVGQWYIHSNANMKHKDLDHPGHPGPDFVLEVSIDWSFKIDQAQYYLIVPYQQRLTYMLAVDNDELDFILAVAGGQGALFPRVVEAVEVVAEGRRWALNGQTDRVFQLRRPFRIEIESSYRTSSKYPYLKIDAVAIPQRKFVVLQLSDVFYIGLYLCETPIYARFPCLRNALGPCVWAVEHMILPEMEIFLI
ncbi:hypothetical protein FIBSPDRAFT_897853 [Athelia psychrophila]|uniref:Uncharacterized protein n=1 Tax=Athelia psychrophila TaxID=1759441 RepID=A0A166BPN4_9AGAM|nr:hypothetical protein FIBSPDRAFT_897853 [Fibularhizoctonia sp. CBS 109695]